MDDDGTGDQEVAGEPVRKITEHCTVHRLVYTISFYLTTGGALLYGIVIRQSAMALLSMSIVGTAFKLHSHGKPAITYLLSGLVITRCTGSTTVGVSLVSKG